MANLSNARPQWAADSETSLDRAVWAAYGCPGGEVRAEVAEDIILARLLAPNDERAAVDS